MKKNGDQNVESRDKAQILKDQTAFRNKSSTYEKINLVIHYKSSGVILYMLSDFDQNLSIRFSEKCQQTLQNSMKLQNRFIYHDSLVREII